MLPRGIRRQQRQGTWCVCPTFVCLLWIGVSSRGSLSLHGPMMLPRERPEVRSSRLLFLCYDCYYYHYHSAVSRNSRFIVVVIHQGVQLFVQILLHPRAAQLHSMQLQEKTSKWQRNRSCDASQFGHSCTCQLHDHHHNNHNNHHLHRIRIITITQSWKAKVQTKTKQEFELTSFLNDSSSKRRSTCV